MMDQPKSNSTRADRPLQVVRFDLFGPCKHPSFAGHTYCVILVDDHSRYTWVYILQVGKTSHPLSRCSYVYCFEPLAGVGDGGRAADGAGLP